MIAATVATNVKEGTNTSSPAPMPSAFSARNSAAVPFDTATASVVPATFAKAFSKASVRGPAVLHSVSIVSSTRASSSSLNASSDSRAFHMIFQKYLLHVGEVVIRPLIIVGAANIQPVGVAFVGDHAFLSLEETLDQLWKIEFLEPRD